MPSWPDGARRRAPALAAAGWTVPRLPAAACTADLSTDAALGVPDDRSPVRRVGRALDEEIEATFGPVRAVVTSSGRLAEAVVAAAFVRAGSVVPANEVYVTGEWWIERFGGAVVPWPEPVGGAELRDGPRSRPAGAPVSHLHLTAPPARLAPGAGRAVPLATFAAARAWLDRFAPDAPLVVDGSRLWEDAAATGTRVDELVSFADVVVLSATKDLGAASGGLVVVRDERWWPAIADAAEVLDAGGRHVTAATRDELARGLAAARTSLPRDRWRSLDALARDLVAAGRPIHSWGAGSLFLDPTDWVPHVPPDELPAQTLLAAIWLLTGWRGLGSTTDDDAAPLVRLAVRDRAGDVRAALPAIHAIAAELTSGLRPRPRDRAAPYLQPASPADPAAWPVVEVEDAARPDDPDAVRAERGWLVGRVGPGLGPQRAVADAWARVHPGVALATDDAPLAALLVRCAAGSTPGASDAVQQVRDLDAWTEAARDPGVELVWASTDAGGIVAVRRRSPLAAAVDRGSLCTLGCWLAPADPPTDET